MTNETQKEYLGRQKIYTDYSFVDKTNIFEVLQKALLTHRHNATQIRELLQYEKGHQPLQRKKTVRSDIDIQNIQNLAHYITDFKVGYNWGNPISYVKKNTAKSEGNIQSINMMLEDEEFNTKNIELFRYVEIAGIGYTYTYLKKREEGDETQPIFDYQVINPEFAFKVYCNDINETPILDVMFTTHENGNQYFYCYTKDQYFYIKNEKQILNGQPTNDFLMDFGDRSGETNPLKMLPLVEWLRDNDRMGCFEREIPALDSLNILHSDFSNDVDQKVQAILHFNDIEIPKDDKGEKVKLKSNDIIATKTTAGGKTPFIKAVETSFDYSGTINKINEDTANICSRCFVPLKQSTGGGSTGTAMSLSSGWQEAEANANKQEIIIKKSLMQVMRIILKICTLRNYDKEIGELDIRDIEPHILRNKTYDLTVKTNAYATLVSHGISLKDSLTITDLSGDIAQVIENSQDLVDKYQEREFGKEEETENKEVMAQVSNSPIVDGINRPPMPPKQDNKQNQ